MSRRKLKGSTVDSMRLLNSPPPTDFQLVVSFLTKNQGVCICLKAHKKLTLQLTIYLTDQIADIAYSYKKDADFTPSSLDIRRFEELTEKLNETHRVVNEISACLAERGKKILSP